MKDLNFAAQNMPRSGIRVILDEANKVGNVLHLEIGQPDFPTPTHIIEAATKAAYDGLPVYNPTPATHRYGRPFASG